MLISLNSQCCLLHSLVLVELGFPFDYFKDSVIGAGYVAKVFRAMAASEDLSLISLTHRVATTTFYNSNIRILVPSLTFPGTAYM